MTPSKPWQGATSWLTPLVPGRHSPWKPTTGEEQLAHLASSWSSNEDTSHDSTSLGGKEDMLSSIRSAPIANN